MNKLVIEMREVEQFETVIITEPGTVETPEGPIIEMVDKAVQQSYTVNKMTAETEVMEVTEESTFMASRVPTLVEIKSRIVDLMAQKQDGGISFNGLPVATDPRAKAEIAGAKQKARASRKVVPRGGGGVKADLSQAQFDALHSAVEEYHQSVMDHAHNLLEQVEAAQDLAAIDIEAGWPTQTITT